MHLRLIFSCLQLSPLYAASVWSTQESDWVKLVDSALMFLSGSSGGIVIQESSLNLCIIYQVLTRKITVAMVSVLLVLNYQGFFYDFISPFTV